MIGKTMAAVVVALALVEAPSSAVTADEAPPDSAGGRYMFAKQADGFLRLDTQTGAVALCSQRPVGWACEAAPEDRALLESEIARLRAENAALKKDMLSRGLPLPSGVAPEPPTAQNVPPQNRELYWRLPNDADIGRVIAFVGRTWHRLVEAIARAEKQVFNKS